MSVVLRCRDCKRSSKACACTSHAQVATSHFLAHDPVARYMETYPARRDRMAVATGLLPCPVIWFVKADCMQFLSPVEADLAPIIPAAAVVAHVIRETLAAPPGYCAVLLDHRALHDQMVFSLFHAPVEDIPPALVAHIRESFASEEIGKKT